QAGPPSPRMSLEDGRRMAEAVSRLEDAWRRGERPPLTTFLADPRDDRLLLALALAELELRLKAGYPARIEKYLECYPTLAANSERVVDVIWGEFAVRCCLEGPPQRHEYLERFPAYRPALEERLSGRPPGVATATSAPTPSSEERAATELRKANPSI